MTLQLWPQTMKKETELRWLWRGPSSGVLVKRPTMCLPGIYGLNNGYNPATATVTSCITASHRQGSHSAVPGSGNQKRKRGPRSHSTGRRKSKRQTRLQSGSFYRADMGIEATWETIPEGRRRTQVSSNQVFQLSVREGLLTVGLVCSGVGFLWGSELPITRGAQRGQWPRQPPRSPPTHSIHPILRDATIPGRLGRTCMPTGAGRGALRGA